MNQALEAWKEIPGGVDQQNVLSRSNSSISKGNTPSINLSCKKVSYFVD